MKKPTPPVGKKPAKAGSKSNTSPKSGSAERPKSKNLGSNRELTRRAILVNLIKSSSRSLFGFDVDNVLEWNEGPAEDVGNVKRGDSEHVLEWQTVASFFEKQLGKKFDVCVTVRKFLDEKNAPTFEIEEAKGTLEMSFAKLLADAYPSSKKYPDEFVILDYKPNELIKMHMFANMDIVADGTFAAKKDHSKALTYLRDALAVGLYMKNKEVIKIFTKQKTCMATRIRKAGEAVNCKEPKFNEDGLDLEEEWNIYMDMEWAAAASKLEVWMSEKTTLMDEVLQCNKLEEKTEKTKETEQRKNCNILAFINKKWKVLDEDTFDNAPWKGSAEEESEEENVQGKGKGKQTAGQKRPPLGSPSASDIKKPALKSGKKSGKKPPIGS